jgi:hypothetical protein
MSDDTLRVKLSGVLVMVAKVIKRCCGLCTTRWGILQPSRMDLNKDSPPLHRVKTRLHVNILDIVARTLTERQSFEYGLWLTRASSIRFRCKFNVKVMYKYKYRE